MAAESSRGREDENRSASYVKAVTWRAGLPAVASSVDLALSKPTEIARSTSVVEFWEGKEGRISAV